MNRAPIGQTGSQAHFAFSLALMIQPLSSSSLLFGAYFLYPFWAPDCFHYLHKFPTNPPGTLGAITTKTLIVHAHLAPAGLRMLKSQSQGIWPLLGFIRYAYLDANYGYNSPCRDVNVRRAQ